MPNLSAYISIAFGLTTLTTLILFWLATKKTTANHRLILLGLVAWLGIQATLAQNGIYAPNKNAFPPKLFLFGILPAILAIVLLFNTKKGKSFIDALPIKDLTYLNVVRIPVEIVLYYLFLNKAIPELMTFAGRNFDILAGISAPFVAYFGFTNRKLATKTILIWNVASLLLLINIVANAFLSAPTSVQQFAFEQPNLAIFIFPFCWLPTFIVPIVLLGHFASIRRLKRQKG